MITSLALLIASNSAAIEVLPVDEVMAAYEAALPQIKETEASINEEIGQLGPVDPDWTASGLSAAQAIAASNGDPSADVLGEWEVGGNGVVLRGDRPLNVPLGLTRYSVREYRGKPDYHYYHRLQSIDTDIWIHIYGSTRRIGNAECGNSEGIDLLSKDPWRSWSAGTSLVAFVIARSARDDPNIYCSLFRPTENHRFDQVSYTPEGRPYIDLNSEPQAFALTPHLEAGERMFAEGNSRNPVGQ